MCSCKCTFTKIALVFTVLIGAGLLTYFLVPWDDVWDDIKENIDGNENESNPTSPPTPTASSPYKFEFIQCPEKGEGDCCNGLETNCKLLVNETMFATMNNANHDKPPLANHKEDFEGGLDVGYRGLNFDLCSCDDALIFCHGDCALGRKSVKDAFTKVNNFLNKNPTEVIILNIEMSIGNPTPQDMWTLVSSIKGIEEKTYEHNDGGSWPTMKEMVDDGKQLIIFKHNGSDCSGKNGCTKKGCTPKIIEFFDYTVGTKHSFETISDIEKKAYSCPAYRGEDSTKAFYSVNNFVTHTEGGGHGYGPSETSAKTLNCMEFLQDRTKKCEMKTGLKINMLQVDFWHIGDLPEFVQRENCARGNGICDFPEIPSANITKEETETDSEVEVEEETEVDTNVEKIKSQRIRKPDE